jgi:hypothetical protein
VHFKEGGQMRNAALLKLINAKKKTEVFEAKPFIVRASALHIPLALPWH